MKPPEKYDEVKPQAGGQTRFFLSPAFEVLGGGAAGGGKSWSLVVDALGLEGMDLPHKLPYYRIPGYRAILFRRETKQLARLLDEARMYYPRLMGRFTAQRIGDPGPCYEFPTEERFNPARIYFSHMESEQDVENHQGQQYDYAGFDELTQFTLYQYLYIFSRIRRSEQAKYFIRPRIRATTNPTGTGLIWVKKRFISGLKPNKVYCFLPDKDPQINPQGLRVPDGTPNSISREFVPMFLHENLILERSDPTYAARIMQLGGQMARALLQGDWDAFGGDFFKDFDYTNEVIDPFDIPRDWRLIGSLDPGYSSPCSFGLQALDLTGKVYRVATYYERDRNAEQHAKSIFAFIKECRPTLGRMPDMIVADPSAWAKRDRYAVIAHDRTFADVFQDHGMLLQPGHNDRVQGWWAWKALMPNRYFVFRDMNRPLLEEMTAAIADEKVPEDIEGRGNSNEVEDHALDDQRYAILALPIKTARLDSKRDWTDIYSRTPAPESRGWRPGRG